MNLLHEQAPELLLDKIAELNGIVVKHKIKNPAGDGLKFYEDLIKVMQLAFREMMETRNLHTENMRLKTHVRLFAEENQRLWKKVDLIESLAQADQNGTLEKEIEIARQYTENVLKIHDTVNNLKPVSND